MLAHRRGVLLVSCVASVLIVADVAMINVALPSIADAVGFTATAQQWFLNAYALAFSALPLLAGRLADTFGHRRLFLIGLSLFTVTALLCATASGVLLLEIARALQGVGGALLAATSLSLITSNFTEPLERRRALAIWGACISGGAAAGVLAGGVVTSALGWRAVFGIDVLLGVGCLVATVALGGPEHRTPAAPVTQPTPVTPAARRLDLRGGALVTAALALLVSGLIEARPRGWSSGLTLTLLAAGLVVLTLFVVHESRERDPLVPVALLADARRVGALLVTALVGCTLYFLYFAVSLFLQRARGESALAAGLMSLPAALSVMAAALAAPVLSRRFSPRVQLLGATTMLAAGFFWLSRLSVEGAYWSHLALPMVVIGLGLGASFVPATIVVTAGVPGPDAGIAAGLVNAGRQIGRALGLATLTGLVLTGGPLTPDRLADGAGRAFTVCAVLALVGVVLVLFLFPRAARPA